jgi:hypothetical protein
MPFGATGILVSPLTQAKSLSVQFFWREMGESPMQKNPDNQIALFVRDERTGRHVFNAQALKALGIEPAEARDRGYPLKDDHVRVGAVGSSRQTAS